MKVQQRLNRVWQWLNEDRQLLRILIALLLIQVLVFFVPQAPVPRSDAPGYTRWLAELRSTLGQWTALLSTVGLLTLRTSLWTRGLFVLLSLVVAARSATLKEQRETHTTSWKWLFHGVLCLGSLLVIAGWGAQMMWGWKQPEISAWPDVEVVIPEHGLTLPPHSGRLQLWSGRYGLYLVPRGSSIGLEVQATNEDGNVLPLFAAARSEPRDQLRFVLTSETHEAYFAIPDVGFVFRVSLEQGSGSHVQTQVYRSASGELLAETTLQGSGSLFADNVRLKIEHYVLPRFEAVYNPGAAFECLGMLLLIGVVIGQKCLIPKSQSDAAATDDVASVNDEGNQPSEEV